MSSSRVRVVTAARALDEGFWVARRLIGPWGWVLIAGLIPMRLAEVHFFNRLLALGSEASSFGSYLTNLAWLILLALIPASWARMVWVQACRRLISEHEIPDRTVLRVDLSSLMTFFLVKLLILTGLYLTGLSLIGLLFFVLVGGLAAAASVEMRPRISDVWFALSRASGSVALFGITLVFVATFLLTATNLAVGISLLSWLADVIPGVDPIPFDQIVATRLSTLHLVAASLILIEPFWLATMVVVRELSRQRSTGGDLNLRFSRIAAITLLCLGFSISADPLGEPLSRDGYASELARIEGLLARGEIGEASRVAARLEGRVWRPEPSETLSVDDPLLSKVRFLGNDGEGSARELQRRIAATRSALETPGPWTAAPPVDRERLSGIEEAGALPALPAGGHIVSLTIEDPSLLEDLLRPVRRAWEWISETLESFFDWFYEVFFGEKRRPALSGLEQGGALAAWITGFVVVIALLIIATYVLRRSRRSTRASAGVSVHEIRTVTEEDPRSRESNQWLDLADRLIEAGRVREALRAAYNAVLTTLFSEEHLSYRKGRTNWEYVRTISSSLAWKRDFVRVTNDFDQHWYGAVAPDQGTYRTFRSAVESILSAIGGRP